MNKTRKVDLLYKRAHGQALNASRDELNEIKKYKVYQGEDSFYTTKRNIGEYVSAVDVGKTHMAFYDWCINNCKADRRVKGGSEKDLADYNSSLTGASMFMGFFFWGIALYWFCEGQMPVVGCGLLGGLISVILRRFSMRWSLVTCIILPILIAYWSFSN